MSWIRDIDGDVINLDDVRRIAIEPLMVEEPGSTHAVFAYSRDDADDDDPSYVLYQGIEADCDRFFSGLAAKLPMVKL